MEIKEMNSKEVEEFDKAKKRKEFYEKVKGYAKQTGSGAAKIGAVVGKGAATLAKKGVEKYKEYNSDENRLKRAEAAAKRAEIQAKINEVNARARKYQPQRQQAPGFNGNSGFAGFEGVNNVLGTSNGGFKNPFACGMGGFSGTNKAYKMPNPFGSGNMKFGGFNSGFNSFMGSKPIRKSRRRR